MKYTVTGEFAGNVDTFNVAASSKEQAIELAKAQVKGHFLKVWGEWTAKETAEIATKPPEGDDA